LRIPFCRSSSESARLCSPLIRLKRIYNF
jgi:hypothetical protein